MKKITRPWQATALSIIGSIKIVSNTIILLALLLVQEWFGAWLSQFDPELGVVAAIKPVIFLPLIGSIILSFFIVRGLWKGQKWSPIFLAIMHGAAVILMGFWMIADSRWAIPFAITLFLIALEFECLLHPFFRKNRR